MKTLVALFTAVVAAGPQFEVASVRLTPPSREHALTIAVRLEPAHVHLVALPLWDVIALAHQVPPSRISGPDWMRSTLVDISATLPAGAQTSQVPEMLRVLLADRFGLRAHAETRETAAHALVLGIPPVRLQRHQREPDAVSPVDGQTWALSGGPSGVSVDRGNGSSYSFSDGRFEGRKLTTAALAIELSRYSARPIVDATMLAGEFDVRFSVDRDAYRQLMLRAAYNSGMTIPPAMLPELDGGDAEILSGAVEQMGLELESRRMPVEVIVVDDVQRTPTVN
jgi:uncharacterized protein (TIGR03435 family)